MNDELPELLKIAATFVGTVGGMQLIAARNKKARREELKDFEQRLERIEKDLQRLESKGREHEDLMGETLRKLDTVSIQVGDMREILQKLLDIQLQVRGQN